MARWNPVDGLRFDTPWIDKPFRLVFSVGGMLIVSLTYLAAVLGACFLIAKLIG